MTSLNTAHFQVKLEKLIKNLTQASLSGEEGEEDIHPRRLEHIPAAALCISCAEEAEK